MKSFFFILLFVPITIQAQLSFVGAGRVVNMEIKEKYIELTWETNRAIFYDISQATKEAISHLKTKSFYVKHKEYPIVDCIYTNGMYHLSMKDYPDIGMRSQIGIKTLIANFITNANTNKLWPQSY